MEHSTARRRLTHILEHLAGADEIPASISQLLPMNCSSTLNSMVSRCDNRLLFARQGSASQAYYMQQSSNEKIEPGASSQRCRPLNSSCCGSVDSSHMHFGEPKFARQAQVNDSTLCSSSAKQPMKQNSVLSSCDAPKFARDAKIEKEQQTSDCIGMAWSPRMDVAESGSSYVVTVELAGISIADIQVQVDDQNLTVIGERLIRWQAVQIGSKTNPMYHQREILQGPYRVVWPLPNDVNKDAVAAKFVDGFLHITLPKM
ncbi:uncharacterized protein [Typha latifolia]|uniref:uncharacterized protein isoform X1 n=1 Tax=Typha latifolia TaxID=4733 RepID=UPI003C30E4BF